jgi:hypothetical protein
MPMGRFAWIWDIEGIGYSYGGPRNQQAFENKP